MWPGLYGGETIPQKQRGRLCCRPLPVASLFRLCQIEKQHLLKGSWSENFSLWKTLHRPFPIESAMFALRISDFPFAVVSDLQFSAPLPFRKVQGKAECNFSIVLREVRFSSISRFVKLEKSEFDCAFCKSCMEVQHMVSAVIVVLISAVIRTVCPVPDVGELSHGSRFFLIQLFNEFRIYRSAVSVHSEIVNNT